MYSVKKGNIIGEFDLYDYWLPTTKGYLFHQVTNGGNSGNKYPANKEYLRIIGLTIYNQIIEYSYVYFMLYITKEGLSISKYIGCKVFENYRNKGLGDLLMSMYLYYSYDNGFRFIESTTRQRKLDVLSLMSKYGFRVKEPEKYNDGERITLFRNNMVVDIYKQNEGGLYYRFKTSKAEELYRKNNAKIAVNYNYLSSQTHSQNSDDIQGYKKLGWIVPNEEYERIITDDSIIESNLDKSGFSK